jgi:hypothetical protein
MHRFKLSASLAATLTLLFCAAAGVAGDKPNPTGTWKYTVMAPDGQSFDVTATLKLDGDKLTGTVKRGEMETKIEDGKFKDGEVTFKVNRENNGMKFTVNYKGKITGDTLKGKIMVKIMDQDIEIDWDAKREKK